MLLATMHGFAAMEPRLYEVSQVLGPSRPEVIWKLALPSAMPMILASLRLGLTISLILAVVGEMPASREGLGQSQPRFPFTRSLLRHRHSGGN